MKRIMAASAASALVFGMGAAYADSHEQEARRFVRVEPFSCKYRAGQGPSDLAKVSGKWYPGREDKGEEDSFSMTVTPH